MKIKFAATSMAAALVAGAVTFGLVEATSDARSAAAKVAAVAPSEQAAASAQVTRQLYLAAIYGIHPGQVRAPEGGRADPTDNLDRLIAGEKATVKRRP